VGLLLEFTQRFAATDWCKSRRSLSAFFLAFIVTTVVNWNFAVQTLPFGKAAEIDHEQDATQTHAAIPAVSRLPLL